MTPQNLGTTDEILKAAFLTLKLSSIHTPKPFDKLDPEIEIAILVI